MRADRLSELDLRGFSAGHDARSYEKLGAHPIGGGVAFAVWAPNARRVSVIGEWNGWNPDASPLAPIAETGVWHGVVADAREGHLYKYRIESRYHGYVAEKADPYGFLHEVPPGTASIVSSNRHVWRDGQWLASRKRLDALDAPISIYEVHLGSWRRVPEEGNRPLRYRELARELSEYVARLGFTHVELMPVTEHPFYRSWGYGVTGYFAPTHRYGNPEDLMALVDALHARGIGVILDWVPAHFPSDAHGLGYFDGTHLYEHADPRLGFHPEWNSCIFNYSRNEVRSFLLSSAMFWFDRFHVDGLRVDGVSSMLYLDYARKPGEWIPNPQGGRENLAAISLLRELNVTVYREHPDVQMIAEESTAWPLVSKPIEVGGLGFGLKWDMGWMHDTLAYFALDPIHRSHHQGALTFRSMYAFVENYVLPLSHDEVVYGKGSILRKMPGDDWQKFASVRLLYSYMWALPGKKLLFMGDEFAQWNEWNHESSLDWHLFDVKPHGQIARLVGTLNHLYRSEPALHRGDARSSGFAWVDGSNARQSVLTFVRRDEGAEEILVACNFTPVPRLQYRIGVSAPGRWREIFNSDAKELGGSGHGNLGAVESRPIAWNGRRHSVSVTLPPLGAVFFKVDGAARR
jgi:1,4-alpha-glucan branching enzyme